MVSVGVRRMKVSPLTIGMDGEGDGSGEQGELGVGDIGGGIERVEDEDGVRGEVEGGGVFKLDFGAAVAGGEAEAGLEGEVGDRFFPVDIFGGAAFSAARDTHVSLEIADADELGEGSRRFRLGLANASGESEGEELAKARLKARCDLIG